MIKLGIDIDGVITEIPELIRILTNSGQLEVHIITFRDNYSETIDLLNDLEIEYKYLHMPSDEDKNIVEWKKSVIIKEEINMMIEDMPEVLAALPENVKRIWVCDPEVYNLRDAIKGMKAT